MDDQIRKILLTRLNAIATLPGSSLERSDFAPWSFLEAKIEDQVLSIRCRNSEACMILFVPFDGPILDGSHLSQGVEKAVLSELLRWEEREELSDGDE